MIAALTSKGLQVPADIRVVGYDDVAMSAYVHPSITSIRQPTELAAKAMVRMLLDEVMPEEDPTHDAAAPARLVQLEAKLIERDSSL